MCAKLDTTSSNRLLQKQARRWLLQISRDLQWPPVQLYLSRGNLYYIIACFCCCCCWISYLAKGEQASHCKHLLQWIWLLRCSLHDWPMAIHLRLLCSAHLHLSEQIMKHTKKNKRDHNSLFSFAMTQCVPIPHVNLHNFFAHVYLPEDISWQC